MDKASIRETFPKRYKYYMELRGKTRSDIVRDLGFKYTTIRDWETGATIPRMDKVEMLARYFGCSNSDLLEDKKEKPAGGGELSPKKKAFVNKVMQMSDAELERLDQILRIVEGTDK